MVTAPRMMILMVATMMVTKLPMPPMPAVMMMMMMWMWLMRM